MSAIVTSMDLDTILKYMGSGIVLHALELIEEERQREGATEYEIDARIAEMNVDEMIHGVAVGIRLMAEHPEFSELDEAEWEGDMFEEIHEYLREHDEEV